MQSRWLVFRTVSGIILLSFLLGVARSDPPANGLPIQQKTLGEITDLIRKSKSNLVVFHLYASWCPACEKQFPEIVKLADRYRAEGYRFKLLAVSVDDKVPKLQQFLRDKKLNSQPMMLTPGPKDSPRMLVEAGMKEYQDTIPYTAIFDMKGKCVKEFVGVTSFQKLYRAVDDIYIAASPVKINPPNTRVPPEEPGFSDKTKSSSISMLSRPKTEEDATVDKDAEASKKSSEAEEESSPNFLFIIGGGLTVLLIGAGVAMMMRREPPPPSSGRKLPF